MRICDFTNGEGITKEQISLMKRIALEHKDGKEYKRIKKIETFDR